MVFGSSSQDRRLLFCVSWLIAPHYGTLLVCGLRMALILTAQALSSSGYAAFCPQTHDPGPSDMRLGTCTRGFGQSRTGLRLHGYSTYIPKEQKE
ncbi:hypothetical protein F5Y10DRAFT_248618 [Nemania abortiva]|nr:hypothetical protein F5Y10DRAFT_248618 [Nemania abortiva]